MFSLSKSWQETFKKDERMLSVKICGYIGSILITFYLAYFTYFACTVFDEINKSQPVFETNFYREESYFELKNERHVTPGKDFFISTGMLG